MMRALWCVAALALLLTGCSDSPGALTVAMKDMHFRQGEVHVRAGQQVTLRVVNEDGYAHAFDIDAFAIHRPLVAHETAEIIFTPEAAGQYTFYCGSPGHVAAGMSGVLIVEE